MTIRIRLEATRPWPSRPRSPAEQRPIRWPTARAAELRADVQLLADTLRESGHKSLADGLVQHWLDRIAVLGFHTAELDIREESSHLADTVQELAAELGLCIDFLGLREDRKQSFLLAPPPPEVVRRLAPERLSPSARETLDLFRLLARTTATHGPSPLGALIVSMTHHASDVLRWSGSAAWERPAKGLSTCPCRRCRCWKRSTTCSGPRAFSATCSLTPATARTWNGSARSRPA